MPDKDRAALEARWLELTDSLLPSCAKARHFPVYYNHCFQRIFLDNACGEVWYNSIKKRPAYKHAPDKILTCAIALAEDVYNSRADIHHLNQISLTYRNKV